MEFEKAKSYLSAHVDDHGTSIYSHIAAISRRIIEEEPENGFELFENLSLELKQSTFTMNKTSTIANEEQRAEIQRNVNSILTLYGRGNDSNEEPLAEMSEITNKCADILKSQQLLSWAGVALSNEETYQLQCALVRLIRRFGNIETSRFWGKINAINSDYYVIEAKLVDTKGFAYFVTLNPCGEWLQLTETIRKNNHRLLTGDLQSESELLLLRTRIAQISADTILAPTQYYKLGEDSDKEDEDSDKEDEETELQLNEEFTPDSNGGLSKDSWVHQRGAPILRPCDHCYIRRLNKDMPYQIIVVNSALWNGAKTIYISHTKTFMNIYIGNGLKHGSNYYTPTLPLNVQSQFEENNENNVSMFCAQNEEFPPLPKE